MQHGLLFVATGLDVCDVLARCAYLAQIISKYIEYNTVSRYFILVCFRGEYSLTFVAVLATWKPKEGKGNYMKSERLLFVGVFLVSVFILGFASQGRAAGFALYEWSARGNALGGTLVARPGADPSALAYNPAGITQLEGTHMAMGASMINPTGQIYTKYDGVKDDTSLKNDYWFPAHFYATHKVNDKVALGFAMFSRFGLGTSFDDTWPGRYNLTKVDLESISFQPTVAIEVYDGLSVAVGIELMYMWAELKKDIDASQQNDPATYAYDVGWKLKGSGIAPGGVVGLRYELNKQWAFGVTYRTPMEISLDGKSFLDPSEAASAAAPGAFVDTDSSLTLHLPDSVTMGVAYSPLDNLSFEFTAMFTRWSEYEELKFEFDKPIGGKTDLKSKKDWNDSWRFAFGVEYEPREWVALRASYVYDNSPINDNYDDYMLAANDRQIFSGGVGFKHEHWSLDLSYSYLTMRNRDFEDGRQSEGIMPGYTNDCYAQIASVTVGYAF